MTYPHQNVPKTNNSLKPLTRKTRIVLISDTQNLDPTLPKGDVLIHAGNLTNHGTQKELQKAVDWIAAADFECKIVVAGNRDITLDHAFYTQHGLYFHNRAPQDPERCKALLTAPKRTSKSPIIYLQNQSSIIHLTSPHGPRTHFKIYGSPLSPHNPADLQPQAFTYGPSSAPKIYSSIPLNTHIIITHTPPKWHLDERADRRSVGCEYLRQALWRVRPKLAVCGLVGEARGCEIVTWDLRSSNHRYREVGVERSDRVGAGGGQAALDLLDLSAGSGRPLLNDGAVGDYLATSSRGVETRQRHSQPVVSFTTENPNVPLHGGETRSKVEAGLYKMAEGLMAVPVERMEAVTRGQGGDPTCSRRCDIEALSGRLGRKETCIVNASGKASTWSHHGKGGKLSVGPIVVDVDLPVYDRYAGL